jgi:hypothetical protein
MLANFGLPPCWTCHVGMSISPVNGDPHRDCPVWRSEVGEFFSCQSPARWHPYLANIAGLIEKKKNYMGVNEKNNITGVIGKKKLSKGWINTHLFFRGKWLFTLILICFVLYYKILSNKILKWYYVSVFGWVCCVVFFF